MNRNFMKLAFVSALAFAATQGVNAQMSAPGWAQEQNATVQHVGANMKAGDRFFAADEVLLFEITDATAASDYTYKVKVVGVNNEKVSGLTALTIAFSDYDNDITSKIDAVEAVDVYEPSAMKTKVTGVSLTAITKLTVGITAPNDNTSDHLSTFSTGIVSISDNAFANLTGLTEIITYNTTPAKITTAAFTTDVYNTAKLSVAPSKNGTVAGKHAIAAGWQQFKRLYTNGDTYAFGDVNEDGKFSTADATRLSKYISSPSSVTGKVNLNSIDVNGDNKKSTADVTKLRKMISAGQRKK